MVPFGNLKNQKQESKSTGHSGSQSAGVERADPFAGLNTVGSGESHAGCQSGNTAGNRNGGTDPGTDSDDTQQRSIPPLAPVEQSGENPVDGAGR